MIKYNITRYKQLIRIRVANAELIHRSQLNDRINYFDMSYHIIVYHIIFCFVLYYIILHYMTLYHIILYHYTLHSII